MYSYSNLSLDPDVGRILIFSQVFAEVVVLQVASPCVPSSTLSYFSFCDFFLKARKAAYNQQQSLVKTCFF